MIRLLIATSLLMGLSVSRADERRREERRDHRMEEEELRRREHERAHWVAEHPVYHEVIAPAPVVYVPPPPSPGISIVLPINIH